MAKSKSVIQNASTKGAPSFVKIGDPLACSVDEYRVVANSSLEDYDKVQANRRENFSNILPGISSYPELTWSDYEWFRPDEAIPGSHVQITQACNKTYFDNGLIRNITDLMGDFTAQGIRFSHRNKRNQTFLRNWARQVNAVGVSERFANMCYRLANVPIRRMTAILTPKVRDELFKANAEADLDATPDAKRGKEIPWKYVLLNPATVTIAGGPLSSFAGKRLYALNIPGSVKAIISAPKTDLEKQIVDGLPEDIKKAAKSDQPYPLPPDKIVCFHYKKDDWQTWATPICYSVLKHINLYNRLILADHAALDGAISNLRMFILGDLDKQIVPTDAAIAKLAGILENNTGAGVINLIWGPDLKFQESNTNVHQFLGDDKYLPALRAIYECYGIPPTLTGGTMAGGTTNNFISLKTLTERLEYGRSLLREFWNGELKILQKAMGWKTPGVVEFDLPNLGDENAENALFLQLVDRGLVSDEVIQLRFGQNPEMEQVRLKRETREKKSGRRAKTRNQFLQPETNEENLKKIALQTGVASPSEVGLELDEKEKGEKSLLEHQEKMAKMTKQAGTPPGKQKSKGRPGQGRPVNKKDSTKRKTKEFKPKLKAMEIWAVNAQERISELMNPAFLKHFNKQNMRMLSDKEDSYAEGIKSSVLYNLEAFTDIDETVIASVVQYAAPRNVSEIYKSFVTGFTEKMNRQPTKDEIKQINAAIYAILRGPNEQDYN